LGIFAQRLAETLGNAKHALEEGVEAGNEAYQHGAGSLTRA
jgi:hypothetical protein